jgi:hypothetical protein
MLWLRRLGISLSLLRTGFVPGSVHVGFVVHKVVLGQVSLRGHWFRLSVSFHCGSPCSYIIWGMNSRPVGSRSSETQSHPIDMNKLAFNLMFVEFSGM